MVFFKSVLEASLALTETSLRYLVNSPRVFYRGQVRGLEVRSAYPANDTGEYPVLVAMCFVAHRNGT